MSYILRHGCMIMKVATPPHVVDKGTKLETIFDRIELDKNKDGITQKRPEIDF